MTWYKGNLHMHSYWSDGHDFPEEVTTSWGDAKDTRQTHWINVFNTPEPVAPQHAVNTRDGAIDLAICPQKGVRYTTRFIGTRKGVDLSSQAGQDAQGKPLRTTRNYSNEIGQVLDETTSLNPSYTCSGDELYVRAVVTADREHPNPTGPNDFEKAWSQPVVPSAQAH